jgi:TRAP-type uncharacterized transport system fused permease subunit
MSFLEIMNTYFRGEKLEAWFFILPVGLLLVVLGVVALKAERGGYAWGVAVPCFLVGLTFIATGIGVGSRTDGQVAELTRGYEDARAEMVRGELPRMEKVSALFRTTYVVFGVFTVVGLLLIFALNFGWSKGLGAALILVAALGFLIDGFAGRRTVPYIQALEQVASEHGPAGDSSSPPEI